MRVGHSEAAGPSCATAALRMLLPSPPGEELAAITQAGNTRSGVPYHGDDKQPRRSLHAFSDSASH